MPVRDSIPRRTDAAQVITKKLGLCQQEKTLKESLDDFEDLFALFKDNLTSTCKNELQSRLISENQLDEVIGLISNPSNETSGNQAGH